MLSGRHVVTGTNSRAAQLCSRGRRPRPGGQAPNFARLLQAATARSATSPTKSPLRSPRMPALQAAAGASERPVKPFRRQTGTPLSSAEGRAAFSSGQGPQIRARRIVFDRL